MNIIIRKAVKEDAPALKKMLDELMGEENRLEDIEQALDVILPDDRYCLLAACEENGRVVGTLMGVICQDLAFGGRPFGVVENVVVLSDCRGQGTGKKLFEAIEDWAVKQKKCAYLVLVSGAQRTQAHRFYETIGYSREAGYRKYFVKYE